MPLKGIKVLEFTGLAPGPFCGKILADFGASVLRIDKTPENHLDVLQNGKNTLALDLKNPKAQQVVRKLVRKSDVIIEPFRPGVMEKLNLGPDVLCAEQPRIIYARLTGFGQNGRLSQRAGHDINYVAISGVLSMLSRSNEKPFPPINALADFAGGGLMCALGICLALLERHRSGRGQVVDAAMIDGTAYIASWLFASRSLPIWGNKRGQNMLDGGAYYYDTYQTKDGKYMSVGALEPQFFEKFKSGLGLPHLKQFHENDDETIKAKADVTQTFLQKTQAEWSKIFEDTDACVYPVVDWQAVMHHDHNKERQGFECNGDDILPKPAPRLSRTPGRLKSFNDKNCLREHLLSDYGLGEEDLNELVQEKVIILPKTKANL